MPYSVERQLVNGVWETHVVDETGGGGFTPARNVGQCRLDFAGVAGDGAHIAFTLGQGDAAMIDLTSPASPRPVEAGVYGFTLALSQDGGGDGGGFVAILTVDDDWYSLPGRAGWAGETEHPVAGSNVTITIAPWFCDAASPFWLWVSDSSADTYSGALYVQRVA